ACLSSSGSRSQASSSSSRTSSLLSSRTDDESGSVRGLPTISMTRRSSVSVSGVSGRGSKTVIAGSPGELLLQLGEDRWRHHGADPVGAAEAGELPHVLRGDEGVLRRA